MRYANWVTSAGAELVGGATGSRLMDMENCFQVSMKSIFKTELKCSRWASEKDDLSFIWKLPNHLNRSRVDFEKPFSSHFNFLFAHVKPTVTDKTKKKFSQLIKAAQVELMQILSQPEDEKSCEKNREDKMMIKIPESVHRFDSLCGSPASRQMSKNPFREHLNFLKLSGLT